MNYAEIKNLSSYIVKKIQVSNFLDMMEKQAEKKLLPSEKKMQAENYMMDLDDVDEDFIKRPSKRVMVILKKKAHKFEKVLDVKNRVILQSYYFEREKKFKFNLYKRGQLVYHTVQHLKKFLTIIPSLRVVYQLHFFYELVTQVAMYYKEIILDMAE
jgi:hypothetical protein